MEDQTVEEEATAILECELSREKADVKWFRDGQEIRKTKKHEMVAEGRIRRLIIKDCSLDDSKTYTCDAKDFKTSAFLNVERKYSLSEFKTNQDINICLNHMFVFLFQLHLLNSLSLFMMLRLRRRNLLSLNAKCPVKMQRYLDFFINL